MGVALGESFATLTIEGCEAIKSSTNTHSQESLKAQPTGRQLFLTETTGAETLKLNGSIKTGLSNSFTTKRRANSEELPGLSTTTVTT